MQDTGGGADDPTPAADVQTTARLADPTRVADAGDSGGRGAGLAENAPRVPRFGHASRTVWSGLLTGLAALLVLGALVAPGEVSQLTPEAFVRIPVEALAGAAVLLVLRGRARTAAALAGGALIGILLVLRIADLGFRSALARPFDPVLDLPLLGNAADYVAESAGRVAAVGAMVGAGLLTLAIPVLTALAVRRLAGRLPGARVLGGVAVVWLVCAVTGATLAPPVPLASRSAASLAWSVGSQIPVSLHDEQEFAKVAANDAFHDTPPDRLLTALRGKDVVIAYVESYGRSAVEDPQYATRVDATLDAGTSTLAADGFGARSGWLTSPIAGGGSWLAHATLSSGLWIDNQQRYRSLTTSDRLTLSKALQRTGRQTVGIMPGTTEPWPESRFYGVDSYYDAHGLGYRGPGFGWSPMPDQYALAQYDAKTKDLPGPLGAEITLTSSHTPWIAVPTLRPWDEIGDGSTYATDVAGLDPPDVIWQDEDRVRTNYRESIEYSLNSLVSWVQHSGDDDLVLIVLGDHQPVPMITHDSPSRDVPISVVTRDQQVLDTVSQAWQWQPGLRPGPDAPVWRMDAFRDRFLSTFR
ncbi:sulfatase [Pseudonocardia sp. WMMC193]|uniref:sulfatase n=1 Tax=Pseudonocardia sp. WMMC193 TaxID=2911965 RepID=UPI001F47A2C1|nr:sulfatase [Pseudonocardia sp. WMMC193]MCF7552428.1 sulfatase [Pseudonocardia sp. WMMC193]